MIMSNRSDQIHSRGRLQAYRLGRSSRRPVGIAQASHKSLCKSGDEHIPVLKRIQSAPKAIP
jgi:hypothetical protein